MARPTRTPYHLLALLAWGRHDWLTRQADGSVIAPTAATGSAIWMRSDALRDGLRSLYDEGLLEYLSYHGTYFIARVAPPVGFGRLTGGSTDV